MSGFVKLADHKCDAVDYERAKELRRNPTNGEDILWCELRGATRGKKFRFRRQQPIHPFIVDFVCLKLKLIVEIDGVSHNRKLGRDARRDIYLNNAGYEVMRFTNDDVVRNRDGVVIAIMNRAQELMMGVDAPLP